jgi:hypothetical protein
MAGITAAVPHKVKRLPDCCQPRPSFSDDYRTDRADGRALIILRVRASHWQLGGSASSHRRTKSRAASSQCLLSMTAGPKAPPPIAYRKPTAAPPIAFDPTAKLSLSCQPEGQRKSFQGGGTRDRLAIVGENTFKRLVDAGVETDRLTLYRGGRERKTLLFRVAERACDPALAVLRQVDFDVQFRAWDLD